MYHVIAKTVRGRSNRFSDLNTNKLKDYLNHFSRNRFRMYIGQHRIW